MAITKEIKTDKIEIVGDWNVQVRVATIIKEDNVEISKSFSRHMLVPFYSSKAEDDTWTHTPTDISGEADSVKAIATAAWTDEVKEAYKTHAEA